jgi:hypothetical protein
MTPAQRKYDLDLAASMQRMALWIEPRSRKVSLTLKLAAERIEALITSMPTEPMSVVTPIQPASTPDKP